jgi:hypothetical protein
MADIPHLTLIMEVIDGVPHGWACRGEGRGCKRNITRRKAKHCEDCLETRNDETIGDVLDRLKRGDG